MEPASVVSQHPAAGSRAELVLDALRRLARTGGVVAEQTGTVAAVAGVSSDTVRRAIGDLVRLGLVEELPLRRGKRRTLRLADVGSPQPRVGSPQAGVGSPQVSPQLAAVEAAGGAPAGVPVGGPAAGGPGIAAAGAAHPGSPAAAALAEAARAEQREAAWAARTEAEQLEEREHGLHQVQAILHRLMGADGAVEAADVGACDDACGRTGPRLLAGERRLCRSCWSARQRARLRLEAEARQAGLLLDESMFPLPSRVVLPAGVRL